jgi:signal transduction histidine kinase
LTDLSDSDRKLLASIRKEVWDADHLVRDLVDLARSESGSLKLKLSSVKAMDVIADLSAELEPLAWGNRVQTPSPENLSIVETVMISVNSDRLRQCIINVLENASKYSPEDAPIDLSVTSDDCNIYFDVQDYGPGISQEDQRTIFKPFQRGKSDLNDVPGGGIGLALVHQIVRLMNGSIYILSSGESGTIMRFEFPIE